ncbi:MAG: hypothetical protein ACM3TU_00900 [Bacillota bacterium]
MLFPSFTHAETSAPAPVSTDLPAGTSKCQTETAGGKLEGAPHVHCDTPTVDGGNVETDVGALTQTGVQTVTDAQGNSTQTKINNNDGCGIDLFCAAKNAGFWILKKIALLFILFGALLAGLAGWLLNWMVYITVFQFGNIIGQNVGLLAAWRVLRDLGNILLLFGFIFMGISTILNLPGNEFTARRALPTLIIFAVLMNFSLFAAEAVIDASNALGTTFYRQAGQDTCPETEKNPFKCATDYGIGGSVLKISGVSAIFDPANFFSIDDQIVGDNKDNLPALLELIGLALFAFVAAFVFFAAVVMFLYRTIVLAIIMVVSPIGFAGMAIPPLHEYASMWWKQLLSQSFFAPVYILMVLISIKFMEGIAESLNTASGNSTDAVTLASAFNASGQSNIAMVVNFLLIMGFMMGAVIAAKSMGAMGANSATKFAGTMTAGATGFVARRTVGAGSNALANRIASSKFGRTGWGRFAYNIANKGATSSFDARSTNLVKGIAGANHLEVGAPSKEASHGFHGIEEKAIKERTEYANKLKQTKEEREEHEALETDNDKRAVTKERLQQAWEAEKDRLQEEIADPTKTAAEVKKLKAELAAKEGAHKALLRQIDRETKAAKARQEQISTNNAKREYAENIEHSGWPYPTMDRLANHHAAEEIRKSIKKDGNQKLIDAIGALGGKMGGGAPAAGGHGAGGHP